MYTRFASPADNKYYRYSDPDYSITDSPISNDDYLLMSKAVKMIKRYKEGDDLKEIGSILAKVRDKLFTIML